MDDKEVVYHEKETKKWFTVQNNAYQYPMTPEECFKPDDHLLELAKGDPSVMKKIAGLWT